MQKFGDFGSGNRQIAYVHGSLELGWGVGGVVVRDGWCICRVLGWDAVDGTGCSVDVLGQCCGWVFWHTDAEQCSGGVYLGR